MEFLHNLIFQGRVPPTYIIINSLLSPAFCWVKSPERETDESQKRDDETYKTLSPEYYACDTVYCQKAIKYFSPAMFIGKAEKKKESIEKKRN